MRRAGVAVAEVLAILKSKVRPGVTTLDLEKIAEEETKKRKAVPAFKGYRGYPYCLCTSVNEQVVHGMPSKMALKDGDILSIDFGVRIDGFYGDSAVTLPVGKVTEEASLLMRVTEESLARAIEAAKVGGRLMDVSSAVQTHVESFGFSVVREFVGHGIGRELHEPPQVPNFGTPGTGVRLKEGMVLAIEPMINAGGWAIRVLEDGWTAVTADGRLSAHFEHTVAITPEGPLVLSRL
ncbi:MAG TPA: type I methionyl aminopeptidase [Deltaproteobacteria bacterium]|nr:MAG: type I methionyl aminopeptidase [Deltaproteobacteria bacterium GWA2_55_82]OGQ65186.1 MAG: type I methionyl aminopeptidase [Deltaproteobacteria bacterium RIFCSPLOWO2_02_FULL_55_12]OIJ75156.1 MAG: type I methionyl aminopeptidase [Deltaproteobacteria bacterium GWC2_55_46]HBG45637.1 type I methionyl aminopeptidase [Deltaproteobacteria bacterium]HCY12170.1 type I methionyl aminopeptidase [Deltaproteobacteria bacterium]